MKTFLDKHEPKITGVLSCFDRMLFRGYLPIMSGGAMARFLNQEGIKFRDLKTFLTEHAATLKAHAQAMAEREGRPYIYLASAGSRKEQRAREISRQPTALSMVWCSYFPKWNSVIAFPFDSSKDVLLPILPSAGVCISTITSWIGNLA